MSAVDWFSAILCFTSFASTETSLHASTFAGQSDGTVARMLHLCNNTIRRDWVEFGHDTLATAGERSTIGQCDGGLFGSCERARRARCTIMFTSCCWTRPQPEIGRF